MSNDLLTPSAIDSANQQDELTRLRAELAQAKADVARLREAVEVLNVDYRTAEGFKLAAKALAATEPAPPPSLRRSRHDKPH